MPTLPQRGRMIEGRVGPRRARRLRWNTERAHEQRRPDLSVVLLSRILLLTDMFLALANAETHHLWRVHHPENCLAFSQGKVSFHPQRLFLLVSPQTTPENHHRHQIQRQQTPDQQYTRLHTQCPSTIWKPHSVRENWRGYSIIAELNGLKKKRGSLAITPAVSPSAMFTRIEMPIT